jgi:hypothetical protein
MGTKTGIAANGAAIFTNQMLSAAPENLDSFLGGNLLHTKSNVKKRGSLSGWILLHIDKAQLGGLTTGMESSLLVSVVFYDMEDRRYELKLRAK